MGLRNPPPLEPSAYIQLVVAFVFDRVMPSRFVIGAAKLSAVPRLPEQISRRLEA